MRVAWRELWVNRDPTTSGKTEPEKRSMEMPHTFLTMRVIKLWSTLTKEIMNLPSLAVFEWRLDGFLEDKL